MIADRAAGVICPGGTATALLAAGSPVASGEPRVFAHPVTVAPAVVRRSGAVQAGRWLPGHVRLALLQQQRGDGVIEAVIQSSWCGGRTPAGQSAQRCRWPRSVQHSDSRSRGSQGYISAAMCASTTSMVNTLSDTVLSCPSRIGSAGWRL